MCDRPSPLECLAEIRELTSDLRAGTMVLPPWLPKEDAVVQLEVQITELEKHIAQHGNCWPQDEERL